MLIDGSLIFVEMLPVESHASEGLRKVTTAGWRCRAISLPAEVSRQTGREESRRPHKACHSFDLAKGTAEGREGVGGGRGPRELPREER